MLNFDSDNQFTSFPQNTTRTGLNSWDSIKYKPDGRNKGKLDVIGITDATEWDYDDVITAISAIPKMTANIDVDGIISKIVYKP